MKKEEIWRVTPAFSLSTRGGGGDVGGFLWVWRRQGLRSEALSTTFKQNETTTTKTKKNAHRF